MADRKLVVLGLYATREAVDQALNQFASAGFENGDISVLLSDGTDEQTAKSMKASASGTAPHQMTTASSRDVRETGLGIAESAPTPSAIATPAVKTGAGIGAVAGSAALGWVATLTALAIPGLGPFLVVGPIIGALAGGAAGGAVGALTAVGIPEQEAKLYEERLKKGGILVSVHTAAVAQVDRAKTIFSQTGATDIASTPQP
jgi:hypothetical protein